MPIIREEANQTLKSYVRSRLQSPLYCDPTHQNLHTIRQFFQTANHFIVDPSLQGLLDEFQGIALEQKPLLKWVIKLREQTRKFLLDKENGLQAAFGQVYWDELKRTVALNQEIHGQRVRIQDIENAFIHSYIAVFIEALYQKICSEIEILQQLYKDTESIIAAETYQNSIAQLKNALKVSDDLNERAQKIPSRWNKLIDYFIISSEISNIGIVFSIISKWWSLFGKAGFLTVGFITDPVIYAFKSLIRITRIVGRVCFNITFEDEYHGTHKWQTSADFLSLGFFSVAIPMFLGLIIAGPLSITFAWTLALGGLAVVGYFDYVYPAKLAKEHYEEKNHAFFQAFLKYRDLPSFEEDDTYQDLIRCKNEKDAAYSQALLKYRAATSPEEKEKARQELTRCKKEKDAAHDEYKIKKMHSKKEMARQELIHYKKEKDIAYDEYKTKKNAKWLFLAMYIGLTLLLICGSIASAGVPAAVAFAMFTISKIGSGCLITIALGRFTNWAHSQEWPRFRKLANWIWPAREKQSEIECSTIIIMPKPALKTSTACISQTFVTKSSHLDNSEVTVEEATAIKQQYNTYKKSKLFSPSSDESKEALAQLCPDNCSLTNRQRMNVVISYLGNEKNQKKALYNIMSKELNHGLLKR